MLTLARHIDAGRFEHSVCTINRYDEEFLKPFGSFHDEFLQAGVRVETLGERHNKTSSMLRGLIRCPTRSSRRCHWQNHPWLRRWAGSLKWLMMGRLDLLFPQGIQEHWLTG